MHDHPQATIIITNVTNQHQQQQTELTFGVERVLLPSEPGGVLFLELLVLSLQRCALLRVLLYTKQRSNIGADIPTTPASLQTF